MSNQSVTTAVVWKLAEKFFSKGVQFVVQIILARILVPNDYGIIAILNVFILLSNVFIQNGFCTSLIQKKNATDTDFCTAFFCAQGIALLFYLIIFGTAPAIQCFYHMDGLALYLRAIAIVLFAGAFNSVQFAYVSRNLNFKAYTIAYFIANMIAGFIGIVMAMEGLGVWALIVQQIVSSYTAVIILFVLLKLKIKLLFSINSFYELFGYGWKILGSSLLNSFYASIYNLVIGKVYSSELLGIYSKGQQIPQLITDNVNDIVQSISLPVLAQVQDNPNQVKNKMKNALVINMFVLFPVLVGFSVSSYEVIFILLGEKWLGAVPFLSLLSIVYCFYPVAIMNIQCMKAMGRSDIFLKLEIIKKVLETSFLLVTMRMGLIQMVIGQILLSIVGTPLNTWASKKLIDYGLFEQLRDISPTLFSGVSMAIIVLLIEKCFSINSIEYLLIIKIVMGLVTYIAMSFMMKNIALTLLIAKFKKYRVCE